MLYLLNKHFFSSLDPLIIKYKDLKFVLKPDLFQELSE